MARLSTVPAQATPTNSKASPTQSRRGSLVSPDPSLYLQSLHSRLHIEYGTEEYRRIGVKNNLFLKNHKGSY